MNLNIHSLCVPRCISIWFAIQPTIHVCVVFTLFPFAHFYYWPPCFTVALVSCVLVSPDATPLKMDGFKMSTKKTSNDDGADDDDDDDDEWCIDQATSPCLVCWWASFSPIFYSTVLCPLAIDISLCTHSHCSLQINFKVIQLYIEWHSTWNYIDVHYDQSITIRFFCLFVLYLYLSRRKSRKKKKKTFRCKLKSKC